MKIKFSSPFRLIAAISRSLAAKMLGYRVLASPEVQDSRLVICDNCDKFDGDDCQVCGCEVLAKTALSTESCPLRKWKSSWQKSV